MSTHTDPTVMATHDAYQAAHNDLRHALHVLADEVGSSARLASFDDDGHMRHFDHASGIVAMVLRSVSGLGLSRLMEAGHDADLAIQAAREGQEVAR